jgi:hypothetical protein
MNKKGGLQFVILGSVIVILGIILLLANIMGAMGLIILGALVEIVGLFFYFKKQKE